MGQSLDLLSSQTIIDDRWMYVSVLFWQREHRLVLVVMMFGWLIVQLSGGCGAEPSQRLKDSPSGRIVQLESR
jgi:hypothetical protein